MLKWKSVASIESAILVRGPDSQYIAYNPYTRKIAKFRMNELDLNIVEDGLRSAGFDFRALDIPRRPSITFSVSDKCNLNCIYCFTGEKAGKVASFSAAKIALIDFFSRPDTPDNPTVAFFGSGEPFENFNFIKSVVNLSKQIGGEKNISPRFLATTNGVFSSEKLAFAIENKIYLSVSVDGPPEIQDKQRPLLDGSGSSSAVMGTIGAFVESKSDFHIRTTITNETVGFMPQMVEFWARQGVQKLYLEPVALTGACEEDPTLRPDPKDFSNGFVAAMKVARNHRISINTEAVRKLRTGTGRYFCPAIAGDNYLFTTDGRRSFCYEDLSPEEESCFIPANQSKLYEIKLVPSPMDSVSWPPNKCGLCYISGACGSTCPRRAHDVNGDFSSPYAWQCATNKLLIPEAIAAIAEGTSF
jgi:radical SAM protein with 4Fe4S-binding SPASM domain